VGCLRKGASTLERKNVNMPQAERTQNIIKLLRWLRDVQESASRSQIISYIKVEVTAMGATERTAVSYLEDCGHYGLIETLGSHGRFKISAAGKKWLEGHSH
jgi:hypothetical protein